MAGFDLSNAIRFLSGRMQYLDERHTLIVENMAHVDTPGYKAKDMQFQGFVESALTKEQQALLPGHDNVSAKPQMDIVTLDGHEKIDGNNVNIEHQMANMVDNSTEYMTATEMLKRNLGLIKYSLTDR